METRIRYNNATGQKEIEIYSMHDNVKMKILIVWFVLWTLSGVIVFSQFFMPSSREVKLTYAVWMAFWAYFEYKASVLLSWRRKGKEVLKMVENKLVIIRDINGRGIPAFYEKEKIKNIRTVNFEDKKVLARVQPLYWSMGYETVLFDYDTKLIGLGLQLTKDEANQLVKQLKVNIK